MLFTKQNIESINLTEIIDKKISEGKIDSFLLIYPTNRKIRDLKKKIISASPGKSVKKINIETLTTFSTKLLKESFTAYSLQNSGSIQRFIPLSEAASSVFLKQAVEKTKLRYLSNYDGEIPDGTLDRIKSVISEYKRNGISPDELRKEAENLDRSEKAKALDVADIYEIYKKKCMDLNTYEIGDIYENLNNILDDDKHQHFRKIYPEADLAVIDGFDELTLPEIKIINFISTVPDLTLILNFDYAEDNPYIFTHLEKTYKHLKDHGFRQINWEAGNRAFGKSESEPAKNDFLEFIKKNLFAVRKVEKRKFEGIKITKFTADDRAKEVRMLAKEIKELILREGAKPHKICVAFNLIKNYSRLVRDVFESCGIPFNLTDRITLSTSQPVTAIINFLEIIENDFYYKNIFRAFSSGYIDLPDVNISNLFKAAAELKIISGKTNWINSLNDALKNLEYDGDIDSDEKDAKRKSYAGAIDDINKISGLIEPFDKKLKIAEFKDRLEKFVFSSRLPLMLIDTDDKTAEENIKSVSFFFETINEIFDLIEKEDGREKKYPIQFFLDQIRTASSRARFNVKEKSGCGVLVTNLEEIRGLEFDYLFIGGMCDGDFPTRYNPEIFFSGRYLKQAFIHQTEERFRFYQTLSCWKKGLYLSVPASDGTKELAVSTFLKDLEEIVEIDSKAEEAFDNTLYCRQEILEEAGIIGADRAKIYYSNEIASLDLDVDEIAKAASVDKLRVENPFDNNPFTGFLIQQERDKANESDLIKNKLTLYKNKEYSISQLETYAKCPFKFFIERILNIKPLEEPTEEIEAKEMGSILHSILFEFYTELRDRNLQLQNCSEEVFAEASKIMREIAERGVNAASFNSPVTFYEKEKILGFGGKWENSVLYKFLEEERDDAGNLIPSFFEVSFGTLKKEWTDKSLSSSEPVEIDGIRLRGKIDRIEISEGDKLFNIVDYKLGGKKPTFKELKNGISLQLPVYLYAASELLKKKYNKDFSPNDMIIYSLKYSADKFGKDPVSIKNSRDKEITTPEQLINLTIEHVKKYIQKISEGEFCLSPHGNREQIVCGYCQFKSVCRIEEIV